MKKSILILVTIILFGCEKKEIATYINDESILFLGDSQMARDSGTYDIFCKKYPTVKKHRIALGGRTSFWVLDTLQKYKGHYSKVVLFIGTNDAYIYDDMTDSKRNIQEIVSIAKSNHANVILYTVPPTKYFEHYSFRIQEKTDDLNVFIRTLSGIQVIDDNAILNYNNGMLPKFRQLYGVGAGIHLSPYAHLYLFPLLEDKLF